MVIFALSFAACGDSTTSSQSKRPARQTPVAPLSGDAQTGTVGQPLQAPFVVQVMDAAGKPAAGSPVSWSIASGDGTLSAASSTTDASGSARVFLTLGTKAGSNQVRAQVAGAGSATFVATGEPDEPETVRFASADILFQEDEGELDYFVEDQYGNRIADPVLEWESEDENVVSIGSRGIITAEGFGTTMVFAKSGKAHGRTKLTVPSSDIVSDIEITAVGQTWLEVTFTQVHDGTGEPADYQVRFAPPVIDWEQATDVAEGSCSGTLTGTSVGSALRCRVGGLQPGNTYQVQIASLRRFKKRYGIGEASEPTTTLTEEIGDLGPATLARLSGDGQSGVVGARLAAPLVVHVSAQNGSSLPGVDVEWSVAAGGGSVSASTTTTDANGRAQVDWDLGTIAGNGRVDARVVGVGTVSFQANQLPGSPASVAVTPSSSTLLLRNETLQLVAAVEDQYGNEIPNPPLSWQSSNGAAASVASSGLVTALGPGVAQIVAATGGVSATAEIRVPAVPGVTDLRVARSGSDWLELAFTEVGNGNGAPADYQVRYAEGSIAWDQAALPFVGTCAGDIQGSSIGAAAVCRIEGLDPERDFETQVVSFRGSLEDGSAILGPLSNVAAGRTECESGSLTISPAGPLALEVGGAAALAASAVDCVGAPIDGASFEWSSSDASVATVSSSGQVLAQSAGSATIRATSDCCGLSEVQVTVTEPADDGGSGGGGGGGSGDPSAEWPNEPSGFTTIAQNPFTMVPEGWGQDPYGWYYQDRHMEGGHRAVEDPSSPEGDGLVMEMVYPSGSPDGFDPGVHYYGFPDPDQRQELFVGYYVKLDPEYQYPENVQKLGLYLVEAREHTNSIAILRRTGPEEMQLWFGWGGGIDLSDYGDPYALEANQPTVTNIRPGRWYRVEVYAKRHTGSNYDGVMRWWISEWDGSSWGTPQLQAEYTQLQWGGLDGFGSVQIDGTWGGANSSKTQDDWTRYDNYYMSGR